jgi:hypothetical protein
MRCVRIESPVARTLIFDTRVSPLIQDTKPVLRAAGSADSDAKVRKNNLPSKTDISDLVAV